MTNHSFDTDRSATVVRVGLWLLVRLALVLGILLVYHLINPPVQTWQFIVGIGFCALAFKVAIFDSIKFK